MNIPTLRPVEFDSKEVSALNSAFRKVLKFKLSANYFNS